MRYLKYVSKLEPASLPAPTNDVLEDLYGIIRGYKFKDGQDYLREDDFEVPTEEIQKEINRVKSIDWNQSIGLPISKVAEYTKDSAYFTYKDATTPKVRKWIDENVPYEVTAANIYIVHGGSKLLPHRDFIKNQLNFVLEANEESFNRLYVPKEEYKHLDTNAYSFVPYERLDVIQETKLENRKWYFFPCNIIHSVENIKGTRIVLSLSIDDNSIL